MAIIFPVTAFIAASFEHCMANMYYFAIGLLIHWSGEGAAIPLGGVAMNLVVVTLGNWVGGALLVGGVYWVIYRRKRD